MDFRKAMSKFATGITVVTIDDNGTPSGMTVNAFMSISLDPQTIAVSIDESATMFNELNEAKQFGISILSESQQALSNYFARLTDDELTVDFFEQAGVPVIKDALVNLTCIVKEKVKVADHLIYFAEVTAVTVNDGEPVLYFGSEYRTLDKN